MPNRKVFRDSDDDDLNSDEDQNDIIEEDDSDNEKEGQGELLGESDSDSDGAPDDIGFSEGKESALKKVTEALNSIKEQKRKLKDKRKEKEEVFRQQKKQKLEALDKARLPDDFLENIKSAPIIIKEPQKQDATLDADAELQDSYEEYEDDLADKDASQEDFLPLGSSQVKAMYIDDHVKSSLTSAERAAEFRSKQLFGNKIPRETTKSRQSKLTKRKARYR